MNCGEGETHHHYLYCKDSRMSLIRQIKLRSLKAKLERMNTHPFIISTIQRYLTTDMQYTQEYDKQNNDKISALVQEAWGENMHLGQQSLEKGFTSKKWFEAQKLWVVM